MAKSAAIRKTKTPNKSLNAQQRLFPKSSYMLTFFATFAGVAFGVLMSMGLMRPMLHNEVAAATKTLSSQAVHMVTASNVMPACSVPGSGSGAGASMHAAPAMQTASQNGGSGSGQNNNGGKGSGTNPVWVHKLVSGVFANTTATISNTGPDSTNKIETTNRNTTIVSNDNDIHVTNNNPQFAHSGSAESNGNTTGGNAVSGTASNSSEAKFDLSVVN